MARGRVYAVTFNGVSLAATQDLVGILATSGMAFTVHECYAGQITATSVGNLRLTLNRRTATAAAGSGGNAFTPLPINHGDAAATATARINDTTPQSGGTQQVMRADAWNVINGYQYLPPEEDRPLVKPSQGFTMSVDTAPASLTSSGGVIFEELF